MLLATGNWQLIFTCREFFSKDITNATSSGGDSIDAKDTDALEFYNLATNTLLTALEVDISRSQSSFNWRLIITYFNLIKILESQGIGLAYGLRLALGQMFYSGFR